MIFESDCQMQQERQDQEPAEKDGGDRRPGGKKFINLSVRKVEGFEFRCPGSMLSVSEDGVYSNFHASCLYWAQVAHGVVVHPGDFFLTVGLGKNSFPPRLPVANCKYSLKEISTRQLNVIVVFDL